MIKSIDKVIEVIGNKRKDKNNGEKIDMVFDREDVVDIYNSFSKINITYFNT